MMRIMLDTNVLISAFLFRSTTMTDMVSLITAEHRLVLSSFIIEELKDVVRRKSPAKSGALDEFLTILPYELVYTPTLMKPDLVSIRDPADYPVLYSAIIEDVDIFITGDKDFAEIELEKPQILTPGEFMSEYGWH